jgi:hypothetical protein
MDLLELFIGLSLGMCFFLLYTRKKKWNSDLFRWGITGSLFFIGLTGFIIERTHQIDNGFYFLCPPLIYNCFDRWFKQLSVQKQGRDFYLWLSHSDEIDGSFRADNPHVKPFDKLFSILLLVIIIGLMVLSILLHRAIIS